MENLYRYGFSRKVGKDVEETRTIDFAISDESRDRHGTIIPIRAWDLENFNKNGIVGYQHNVYGAGMCEGPDPDDVIGSGRAFIEESRGKSPDLLIGRTIFEPAELNEKAEKIFRKVLHGSLKATSVGFVETKKGDFGDEEEGRDGANPTYYFGEVDLLEYSIVNIPSNANALKKSIRSQTSTALTFIKNALGNKYSFGDIEKMRVGDVLKLVEKDPDQKTFLVGSEAIDLPTGNKDLEIGEHLDSHIKKATSEELKEIEDRLVEAKSKFNPDHLQELLQMEEDQHKLKSLEL